MKRKPNEVTGIRFMNESTLCIIAAGNRTLRMTCSTFPGGPLSLKLYEYSFDGSLIDTDPLSPEEAEVLLQDEYGPEVTLSQAVCDPLFFAEIGGWWFAPQHPVHKKRGGK